MDFEKLYSVLNKRGFFNTLQVLSEYKDYKAEKGDFYKKLNEFSNYNSFLRLKQKLLEKKLISLEFDNGNEYISLTKRGKIVIDNLIQINNLLQDEF